MSEKHLTELPWKTLVIKQGVKDPGLGKALAGYASVDGAKEPAKALEALKEIAELALKLKKANAAKEEVVAHLEEVAKEVKKTTPGLEARVKSATAAPAPAPAAPAKLAAAALAPAKPAIASKPAAKDEEEQAEEEKEVAEFKRDLKQQMVSALAQVKLRAPGEPGQQGEPKPQLQFMAYLAGSACAVIVSRKVGSATKQLLQEIVGGASGGKFLLGECIFEKAAHTFVLEKASGGLAKQLSKALAAETGAKYKVRVRSTDGSMVLDSDSDLDPDAPPAPLAPKAAAPDASAEGMTKFTARFKALQPDLVKAIATRTPKGEEAKRRAAEAGALAGNKDFAQAHRLLDTVEALMKQALAAPAAAIPSPPAQPPGPSPKLSAYMNATRDWKAAKAAAANGVFALKNAIFAACDPELKDLVKARSDALNSILEPMDDAIIAKIQEAGSEADEERQAERNQALVKFANTMLAAVRNHPLAKVVESNPFGTFTIHTPVEAVLTRFTTTFAG
jgi:hypothetical protein